MFGLVVLLGVAGVGAWYLYQQEQSSSSPPEFGSRDPGVLDTRQPPLPPPPPPVESPDQWPVVLPQYPELEKMGAKTLADIYRAATKTGGCVGCGGGQ